MISEYPISVIIGISIVVRVCYLLWGLNDLWGDSYHNVFISLSTIDNNWVYSDYKGRELVWLPFHRYLVAAFMFMFSSDTILVGQLLSLTAGVLTVVLVYLVALRTLNHQKNAFLAALIFSLIPWHIAYSTQNMPDTFSPLILIAAFYFKLKKQFVPLIIMGFTAILLKNETALYLALLGAFWLMEKSYRSAVALAGGAFSAVMIWGWWCYVNTGSFFYWITERLRGSGFEKDLSSFSGHTVLLSLLWIFPYILILLIVAIPWIRDRGLNLRNSTKHQIVFLTLFNWLLVLVMQFEFFSYPDSRYFIHTLPFAAIILIMAYEDLGMKVWHQRILIGMIPVILVIEMPIFYFASLDLFHHEQTGKEIMKMDLQGNICNDFPVTWYFSQTPVDKVFSAGQLERMNGKPGRDQTVSGNIINHEIRYVVTAPATYSRTHNIWPESRNYKEFEWQGLSFIPIYQYLPFQLESTGLISKLKNQVLKNTMPMIVWEVKPIDHVE